MIITIYIKQKIIPKSLLIRKNQETKNQNACLYNFSNSVKCNNIGMSTYQNEIDCFHRMRYRN